MEYNAKEKFEKAMRNHPIVKEKFAQIASNKEKENKFKQMTKNIKAGSNNV